MNTLKECDVRRVFGYPVSTIAPGGQVERKVVVVMSIVEPGPVRSDLVDAGRRPASTTSDYAVVRGRIMASFDAAIAHGLDPAAGAIPAMLALLTQAVFERGLRRRFRPNVTRG